MTVSSAVPGRPTESSESRGWASWTAASCGPEPALRTAAPGPTVLSASRRLGTATQAVLPARVWSPVRQKSGYYPSLHVNS